MKNFFCLFQDFQGPEPKFKDFPGPGYVSAQFQDFPGFSRTVATLILNTYGGMIGVVGKSPAFQPQSSQFDPRLCRDLNI